MLYTYECFNNGSVYNKPLKLHTSVYSVLHFNTLKTIEALICAACLVLVQPYEGRTMIISSLQMQKLRLNNLLKVCVVTQRRARI